MKTWRRPNEEKGRSKKSALIGRTDHTHRWIASVDWLGIASDEVSLIRSTNEDKTVPIGTSGPAVLKKEKFVSTGSTDASNGGMRRCNLPEDGAKQPRQELHSSDQPMTSIGAFLLAVGAGGQGDICEHWINRCTQSLSIGSSDDWALFRGTFSQRLVWGVEAPPKSLG